MARTNCKWTILYTCLPLQYIVIVVCVVCQALYPGLLTPAFVACSTNMGKGLVKLITCCDVPGHWVDVWRSGIFLEV